MLLGVTQGQLNYPSFPYGTVNSCKNWQVAYNNIDPPERLENFFWEAFLGSGNSRQDQCSFLGCFTLAHHHKPLKMIVQVSGLFKAGDSTVNTITRYSYRGTVTEGTVTEVQLRRYSYTGTVTVVQLQKYTYTSTVTELHSTVRYSYTGTIAEVHSTVIHLHKYSYRGTV